MPILKRRTTLSPYVIRRAAYDRIVPSGSDSGFLHWMSVQTREFAKRNPHLKGETFQSALDCWLENLQPTQGAKT